MSALKALGRSCLLAADARNFIGQERESAPITRYERFQGSHGHKLITRVTVVRLFLPHKLCLNSELRPIVTEGRLCQHC